MATEFLNTELIFGIISALIAVISVVVNIVQAYKKSGLSGAIAEINKFFTMHDTEQTSVPDKLESQTYLMEEETKQSIIELNGYEDYEYIKSQINANQEAGIISYVLDLTNYVIKIDYGQITSISKKLPQVVEEVKVVDEIKEVKPADSKVSGIVGSSPLNDVLTPVYDTVTVPTSVPTTDGSPDVVDTTDYSKIQVS